MKVRQIKQMHIAAALSVLYTIRATQKWWDATAVRLNGHIAKGMEEPPVVRFVFDGVRLSASASPAEPAVAIPEVKTYTLIRKKDGVVAGEYQALEEAEAAIAAAKRQKKAALELLVEPA